MYVKHISDLYAAHFLLRKYKATPQERRRFSLKMQDHKTVIASEF